jgi:CheY-like chemotaxis protein
VGLRVLVIEDEMTIALMIEDMLADLGHEVVDLPMRLPLALEAVGRGGFDLAILDVNLDGETSYPVAELLRQRGVPFVFATGYGASGLTPEFRDQPVLQKPFLRDELERALAAIRHGG